MVVCFDYDVVEGAMAKGVVQYVGPKAGTCLRLICIFSVSSVFFLGQLSHFTSCFDAGVTNLNEPPSSFLLPPYYFIAVQGHSEQQAM